jgi:hypothetical protein
VTIELAEERYAEFAAQLAAPSGIGASAAWHEPRAWRIDCAVHWSVVLPDWRIEGRVLIVAAGTRRRDWTEWREHWVLAKDRHQALGCLVRDLRREACAEGITRAVVYRVTGGRPAAVLARQRDEIRLANCRLKAEHLRARRDGTWPYEAPAAAPGRQMELAGV